MRGLLCAGAGQKSNHGPDAFGRSRVSPSRRDRLRIAQRFNLKNAPRVPESCETLGKLHIFIGGYLQSRTFLPAVVRATAGPRSSVPPSGKSHGGYNPWEAGAHSDFRAWPIFPAVPKTRCESFLRWLAHNRQASTAA